MGWIKSYVEQLMEKYKTNNPFELAQLTNIHVIPWDLHEEINGFYKYDKRNKYIFYNDNLTDEMKYFVVAHELGHALLHPRSNTPFLRNKTLFSIDKIEIEANIFAVELLIRDEDMLEYNNTNLSKKEICEMYCIPEDVSYLKKIN